MTPQMNQKMKQKVRAGNRSHKRWTRQLMRLAVKAELFWRGARCEKSIAPCIRALLLRVLFKIHMKTSSKALWGLIDFDSIVEAMLRHNAIKYYILS